MGLSSADGGGGGGGNGLLQVARVRTDCLKRVEFWWGNFTRPIIFLHRLAAFWLPGGAQRCLCKPAAISQVFSHAMYPGGTNRLSSH